LSYEQSPQQYHHHHHHHHRQDSTQIKFKDCSILRKQNPRSLLLLLLLSVQDRSCFLPKTESSIADFFAIKQS
jgi:hypothetical protein